MMVPLLQVFFVCASVVTYSRTSMARTSVGPWKFVRDMGSSSHWELFIAQGEKANENNLGMSFPSSIK